MRPAEQSNKPSHTLFAVEKAKEGATDKEGKPIKAYFTNIGAAWPTKDGEGFMIKLKALPLDGILVMKPPREEQEDTSDAGYQDQAPRSARLR